MTGLYVQKPRVINLYGGPGAGKSTIRAATFAELKFQEKSVEEILEYAKDATWEKRGNKLFRAQEYIFGKQHFRLANVVDEVELVITDSPILMSLAYITPQWPMQSLKGVVQEAYEQYDNLDIFIDRGRSYDPTGRSQTKEEAIELDNKILKLLDEKSSGYVRMKFGRPCVGKIIRILKDKGWIKA